MALSPRKEPCLADPFVCSPTDDSTPFQRTTRVERHAISGVAKERKSTQGRWPGVEQQGLEETHSVSTGKAETSSLLEVTVFRASDSKLLVPMGQFGLRIARAFAAFVHGAIALHSTTKIFCTREEWRSVSKSVVSSWLHSTASSLNVHWSAEKHGCPIAAKDRIKDVENRLALVE